MNFATLARPARVTSLIRAAGLVGALTLAATLTGCFGKPHPTVEKLAPPEIVPAPPTAVEPPKKHFPDSVPDAVPRVEPRARSGNPPYYNVLGHRYYVLSSGAAFVERGVASWYGPGFDKVKTSTGDLYDMYGMSAAHKTLPLPAYVRVTNLQNGRTCVVRVNDRGPFVGNRIIDLSYTAAAKLDMLRSGTAFVEVRSIDPTMPPQQQEPPLPLAEPVPVATPASAAPPVIVKTPKALFIQAGAFADPANAERLSARLRAGNYGQIAVREDMIAGRRMYRVRIGPVPTVTEFDQIVATLARDGVHDAHLAMD